MSLREECQASEREYRRVIGEAERKRPCAVVFDLVDEAVGMVAGGMKYDPSTDNVEITFTAGSTIRIPGGYLESLRNALNKLLG
jgi:hypothetical protein